MNSGKIPIGFLLFIVVVVAGSYVGWQLGRPWMAYYQFRDAVQQDVKVAGILRERRFRQHIYDAVTETGVWIEDPKHDVRISYQNSPGHVRVSAEWTEYVFFPFDIEYSHDFAVDESASFE